MVSCPNHLQPTSFIPVCSPPSPKFIIQNPCDVTRRVCSALAPLCPRVETRRALPRRVSDCCIMTRGSRHEFFLRRSRVCTFGGNFDPAQFFVALHVDLWSGARLWFGLGLVRRNRTSDVHGQRNSLGLVRRFFCAVVRSLCAAYGAAHEWRCPRCTPLSDVCLRGRVRRRGGLGRQSIFSAASRVVRPVEFVVHRRRGGSDAVHRFCCRYRVRAATCQRTRAHRKRTDALYFWTIR